MKNNLLQRIKTLSILLFLLVFGSCGVNFVDNCGMEYNNFPENGGTDMIGNNEHIKDSNDNLSGNINNTGGKEYEECQQISIMQINGYNNLLIVLQFMLFVTCYIAPWFITGIGGYHNTWKPLEKSSTLYWYRSNLYLNYGLNWRTHFPFTNCDMNIHIFGFNGLAALVYVAGCLVCCEVIGDKWLDDEVRAYYVPNLIAKILINGIYIFCCGNVLQLCVWEIKVNEYYSISVNPLAFLICRPGLIIVEFIKDTFQNLVNKKGGENNTCVYNNNTDDDGNLF